MLITFTQDHFKRIVEAVELLGGTSKWPEKPSSPAQVGHEILNKDRQQTDFVLVRLEPKSRDLCMGLHGWMSKLLWSTMDS